MDREYQSRHGSSGSDYGIFLNLVRHSFDVRTGFFRRRNLGFHDYEGDYTGIPAFGFRKVTPHPPSVTAYKRRYSQWERSFLCQRYSTLTEPEF